MGGSEPILEKGWLLRGESSRFYFEINCDTDVKQTCTYSVSGLDPLTVVFDENGVTIDPHTTIEVFGTVSIPSDASIKTYQGDIDVSCSPYVEEGVSGSVVKQTFHLPFGVKVVEKIEERPAKKFPIPEVEYQLTTFGIFVIIVLIVIVASIGIYWAKKKRTF